MSVGRVDSDACFLCQASDYAEVAKQPDLRFRPQDVFRVVSCRGCGLMYTLPKVSDEEWPRYYPPATYPAYADDVETLMQRYDAGRRHLDFGRWLYGRSLYAEIARAGLGRTWPRAIGIPMRLYALSRGALLPNLLPINRRPGRYLHIGSGPGGRFLRLLQEGWDTAAIDVNEELMARWRRHAPMVTFGRGIKSAAFDPECFDVIFMSHVVEHLTDPVAELGLLRTWLKPTGVFVCELPVYETVGWNRRQEYVYYDVPRHTMHFTETTIRLLLTRAGFEIRKTLRLPDGWSFYYSDFKKYCMTGAPRDCRDANPVSTRARHRLLGWLAWLRRSSGNACVYAMKARP